MKKALIVSTVSRQFYLFEKANIEVLEKLGYEIHAAANFKDINDRLNDINIIKYPIEIERSPFSLKNIKAYKQLIKKMKKENFDIIHCHSPVGGVLTRLAAKSIGHRSVIYTAHGFHFYKGAPILNWLIYFPIEKILSKFTNTIITINKEDYYRATQFRSHKVSYVPGIGVDTKALSEMIIDKRIKRREIGIPDEAFVILSVGELNANKNHSTIIETLTQISDLNLYYLICGLGEKENDLKKMAENLGVADRVIFLGYRDDVSEICLISDVFIFPSFREGLSVSLMEAMALGLPVICSDIRGNNDLITHEQNGYLVNPNDKSSIAKYITYLKKNKTILTKFGSNSKEKILEFDKIIVQEKMKNIYNEVIKNEKN